MARKTFKWMCMVVLIQLAGMAMLWQTQVNDAPTPDQGMPVIVESPQRHVLQHQENTVVERRFEQQLIQQNQQDVERIRQQHEQQEARMEQMREQQRQAQYRQPPRQMAHNYYAPSQHIMETTDPTPYKGRAMIFEKEADMESMSDDHLLILYSHVHGRNDFNPPHRHETIRSLLVALSAFMKKFELQYWLSHGTLLGAHRTKSFIPWDVDADVGIAAKSHHKLMQMMETNSNATSLDFWGNADVQMVVREGKHKHIIPYKFVNTTNGMYIDFLLFHEIDNGDFQMSWPDARVCKTCPIPRSRDAETLFTVSKDTLFPLVELEFEGMSLPAPADYVRYLTAWYLDLKPPRNPPVEYVIWLRDTDPAEYNKLLENQQNHYRQQDANRQYQREQMRRQEELYRQQQIANQANIDQAQNIQPPPPPPQQDRQYQAQIEWQNKQHKIDRDRRRAERKQRG